MKLSTPGRPHLTYCSNIHPAESLAEVRNVIRDQVTRVRDEIGVDPFGIGLRLSARAAEELEVGSAVAELQALLDDNGLYVFTLNGFPYGTFHNTQVKEGVYEPDWRSEERLVYTNRLARILAALLPPDTDGSISTLPAGFRPKLSRNDDTLLSARLIAHALELFRIRERTGKLIELALEPEPHCYVETVTEAVDFLDRCVFSTEAISQFVKLSGLGPSAAEQFLRRCFGVCLDACHLAVEFEEPTEALASVRRRGVRIGKVQVSAGLGCRLSGARDRDQPLLDRLEDFADTVYLHQVVERRDADLRRYLDLPEAILAYRTELESASTLSPRQWRVHFHVPVFMDHLAHFDSTRDVLSLVLEEQRRSPFCEHFEVETYTWDVLPEEFRSLPVTRAIAHELRWTREQLAVKHGDL